MIYKIKKDVMSELFDGEVVIISLKTGNYFSLTGLAADIWDWIAKGIPVENINEFISQHYQGEENKITQSIYNFINELIRDDLIIEQEMGHKPLQNGVDEITLKPFEGKPQFVPPKLERYTDMQALLLLDPIHDVSEEGWPNLPPEKDDQ